MLKETATLLGSPTYSKQLRDEAKPPVFVIPLTEHRIRIIVIEREQELRFHLLIAVKRLREFHVQPGLQQFGQ
jgi:hypothetical protein